MEKTFSKIIRSDSAGGFSSKPWSRLLGRYWDEAPNHGIPRLGGRSLMGICLKMRDPQLYGHFNRDMMHDDQQFDWGYFCCHHFQTNPSKPSLLLPWMGGRNYQHTDALLLLYEHYNTLQALDLLSHLCFVLPGGNRAGSLSIWTSAVVGCIS